MPSQLTVETQPSFNHGAIGDPNDPHPVNILVTDALTNLRGGIDGFFDTLRKFEADTLSNNAFTRACQTVFDQIHAARETLAGCGVELPVTDVNFDTTTPHERLHELGRWVYQFFTDEYPWQNTASPNEPSQ